MLLPETPTLLLSPEWCAYGAKAYTQFATWAAADYLARSATTRADEVSEAYRENVGNAREQARCRVKRKNLWGPSGKHKGWRCEPLSFAYFSLRRPLHVRLVVGVPRRKATEGRCTCCIRDEGWPLGFADQAVIPNHPELHSLRASVVSV